MNEETKVDIAKHVVCIRRKGKQLRGTLVEMSLSCQKIFFFLLFFRIYFYFCVSFFPHLTSQLFFLFQVSFSLNFAKFTLLHCRSHLVSESNDDKNRRRLSSIKITFFSEKKRKKKSNKTKYYCGVINGRSANGRRVTGVSRVVITWKKLDTRGGSVEESKRKLCC